jgi:type VI secretion system protein ImpE
MNASELFKAGKLQEAVDAQLKEVKKNAADSQKRMFLFELAAFAGDLDRAKRQIEAINYDEPQRQHIIFNYRKLLDSELARRAVLREGRAPHFLAPPSEHVQLRIRAVKALNENKPAEAAELINQANEQAPPLAGTLNGKSFASLRDCDDLFAGVLEVMAQGLYSWVPLEQVEALAMNPPKAPRDLLWFPARLTLRDGQMGPVFLPALYPFSHEAADEGVKLGRMTDWKQNDGGPVLGLGQRTFLVDGAASGLLEWREVQFAAEGRPAA